MYRFLFISNNNYIYLKRYFEIFVTNDVLVYSGGQSSALKSKMIKQFWSKYTQNRGVYNGAAAAAPKIWLVVVLQK